VTTFVEIQCRDPIVSRDGRPFGANSGNRMRPVGWLLPSVVAGSLRTALGKAAGKAFSSTTAEELKQVEVAGPLPFADGQVYLPAPHDCVVDEANRALRALPIDGESGGADWPAEGLRPVMLPIEATEHPFKPSPAPAWWPLNQYLNWLIGTNIRFDKTFLQAPEVEYRTHVQLDSHTGAADDGKLFTTATLPLTHLRRFAAQPRDDRAELSLTARVRAGGWCGDKMARLAVLHPLGGERRLAHWRAIDSPAWDCPAALLSEGSGKTRLRMILATPAIFRDGWKPGWLDADLRGSPPGSNLALRLVGVSIARWQAVSGWSLAKPRGPKPVKRMVPAGGVYFFEQVGGGSTDLASIWLEPISDDEQDRRDGFGLAVWGFW
jgi:CRISPR-associated protein Cmr3